jgi:hypothetical protein
VTYLDEDSIKYLFRKLKEDIEISFVKVSSSFKYEEFINRLFKENVPYSSEYICTIFKDSEKSRSLDLSLLESYQKLKSVLGKLEAKADLKSEEVTAKIGIKYLILDILALANIEATKKSLKEYSEDKYRLKDILRESDLYEALQVIKTLDTKDRATYYKIKNAIKKVQTVSKIFEEAVRIVVEEDNIVIAQRLLTLEMYKVKLFQIVRSFKVMEMISIAKSRLHPTSVKSCCIKELRRDTDKVVGVDSINLEELFREWLLAYNECDQFIKANFNSEDKLVDDTLEHGLKIAPRDIYETIDPYLFKLADIDLEKINYTLDKSNTLAHNINIVIGEQITNLRSVEIAELKSTDICNESKEVLDLENVKKCNADIIQEGYRIDFKELGKGAKCIDNHFQDVQIELEKLKSISSNLIVGDRYSTTDNYLPEVGKYYREKADRDRDDATWLQERVKYFNSGLKDFESMLSDLIGDISKRLEFNLEDIGVIKGLLEDIEIVEGAVMDVLCEITKITCMILEGVDTAIKTVEEVSGTIKDIWDTKEKLWNKLQETKITFDSKIDIKIGRAVLSGSKDKVTNEVNSLLTDGVRNADYDKVQEALDESYSSFMDSAKSGISTFSDCSWDSKALKAEELLSSYFGDAKRNLDSCEGESLIDLPDITKIDWDDINMSININLDMKKLRCKK